MQIQKNTASRKGANTKGDKMVSPTSTNWNGGVEEVKPPVDLHRAQAKTCAHTKQSGNYTEGESGH